MAKTFLHIGPGTSYKDSTTRVFNAPDWNEVRLDIDDAAKPDIKASMLDMSMIEDNSFEAIFSSHNIEHVFSYQVITAFLEMFRVLKDKGFLVLSCPDIQQVSIAVAKGNLTNPLYYTSSKVPISAIDILYGHGQSLKDGNHYMAHKCGFTDRVLLGELNQAGFNNISIVKAPKAYALHAIAFKNTSLNPSESNKMLMDHLPYKSVTIND